MGLFIVGAFSLNINIYDRNYYIVKKCLCIRGEIMPSAIFKRNLESINVELSDKQIEQLDKYYEILVEWNSFMNLTGITEYEEVMLKHYLDSLVLRLPIDDGNSHIKLIDVGTGAGFPGLPLKIAYPDTEVVLFDSLNKRIKFLDEVIAQLGLKGISTVHGRAEDGGKSKELREQFDVSVSRAVADLSVLSEYNLPFVKVGGYFVAYKSGEIDEELEKSKKAISILGGQIEKVDKFKLPETDIERSLVYIKKVKNTPKKFPRKAGLPAKEPIG